MKDARPRPVRTRSSNASRTNPKGKSDIGYRVKVEADPTGEESPNVEEVEVKTGVCPVLPLNAFASEEKYRPEFGSPGYFLPS